MTCPCGSPCVPNRRRCEPCLGKLRLKGKLWRAAQTNAGLCVRCSDPATHGTRCQRHAAEHWTPTGRRRGQTVVAEKLAPEREAIVAARKAGKRPGAIAREMGLRVSRVCDVLSARGLWKAKRRAA